MTRTFVNGKELIPNENGKITLPKELQVEMLKFFMRTSIPRAKRKKTEEQVRLVNVVKAIYDMRAQNRE